MSNITGHNLVYDPNKGMVQSDETLPPLKPAALDTSKIPSKQPKAKARRSDQRLATRARYIGNTLEVLAWVALIACGIGFFALLAAASDTANGTDAYYGNTLFTEDDLRVFAWTSIIGGGLVFVWFHFLSIAAGYIRFRAE